MKVLAYLERYHSITAVERTEKRYDYSMPTREHENSDAPANHLKYNGVATIFQK